MQKYTDCFLYFQANCSRLHIVCLLTKTFHNSNETWHIIQVRSPSTITQKFSILSLALPRYARMQL